MTATAVTKIGDCKHCSKAGACRCMVCKTWYCSKECQADHWPIHWRECLPLPDLEWPLLNTASSKPAPDTPPAAACEVTASPDGDVTKVGSAKIIEVSNDSATSSPAAELKTKTITSAPAGLNEEAFEKRDTKKTNCAFTSQGKTSPSKQQSKDKDASIKPQPSVAKEMTVKQPPTVEIEPNKEEITAKSPNTQETVKPPATTKMYEEIFVSDNMTEQRLAKKSVEILPVDEVVSPNNFIIRLADQEQECIEVLSLLNDHMPGPDPGAWKIGRKELVAVLHDDLWYRAMAVKKSGDKFQCFLLDFGNLVTVSLEFMRPLPEPFISVPPFAYQVCLAGVGPTKGRPFNEEDGAVFKDLFTADENYIFVAEFLGQVEGGRFLVSLRGKEDNELVSKLLIEAEMGAEREDIIATPIEKFIVATPEPAAVAPGPVTGPVIPRGTLKPGTNGDQGGVCYFDQPDTFWVCATQLLDIFADILTQSQDAPEGRVNPVVGTCCLALDDEICWYRAEILELCADKINVKVYLLDYGKTIEHPVSKLKPLPEALATIPGLVVKVKLNNIKPIEGETWSSAERDAALLALDVGGDTNFKFKNVQSSQDGGMVFADLEDFDGNDLATFMVDAGCALFIKEEVQMPKRNVLQSGEQDLFILGVESPKEIFLCTSEQFDHFSETMIPLISEAAQRAQAVSEVKEGDKVIVFSEELHYRAVVLAVLENGNVKVELIDLATEKELAKSELKKAEAAVFKLPMLAVKCCLESWLDKDDKEVKAAGEHIQTLLDVYDKVKVNVKEASGDVTKVAIPGIEEKLAKKLSPNVTRANLLKLLKK